MCQQLVQNNVDIVSQLAFCSYFALFADRVKLRAVCEVEPSLLSFLHKVPDSLQTLDRAWHSVNLFGAIVSLIDVTEQIVPIDLIRCDATAVRHGLLLHAQILNSSLGKEVIHDAHDSTNIPNERLR